MRTMMRIQTVVRKGHMKEIAGQEDLIYWFNKSPKERIEAVTFVISQPLKPGERLNKTAVVMRKLHDDIS